MASATTTTRTTSPILAAFVLLNLVLLSSLPKHAEAVQAENVADDIFDAILPTACARTPLMTAASCTQTQNCYMECFADPNRRRAQANAPTVHPWASALGFSPTPAPQQQDGWRATSSSFSVGSPGMENFYIPADAQTCSEMEDPICPAVTCCPACKNELIALYKCIILESDYTALDYLAETCPMGCSSQQGVVIAKPNTLTIPPKTTPPNQIIAPDPSGGQITIISNNNEVKVIDHHHGTITYYP